jgi:hypothetical protein
VVISYPEAQIEACVEPPHESSSLITWHWLCGGGEGGTGGGEGGGGEGGEGEQALLQTCRHSLFMRFQLVGVRSFHHILRTPVPS